MKDKLYVVVINRLLSNVTLEVIGSLPGADIKLAWYDRDDDYASRIEQEANLDATNIVLTLPFHIRYQITDNVDKLPLDQYRNDLQLRLVYI